jgi:lipopolysaccharide/colanic/teichoic acid biosynthesis glycosyltransferase
MWAKNALKNLSLINESTDPSDLLLTPADRQNSASEIFQFWLTFIGLIIISPLFLVIAALIKLTSPGPIFYRGIRVGKDQHVFKIFKFRTLQVGAEEKIGARLLTEQDSFYTKIGKFLKRTKLDELPQLLNVLKGEMNLVGPRPIRPIFLDSLSRQLPLYYLRFIVKPGMTGLAQIQGGYFTPPKDKLRYELIYIKNRSLFFDMKLLLFTFLKLLNRWFTLGFLCLILFLFISLIPESTLPSFYTDLFGIKFNILHLLIILGGSWLLAKRIPNGKLYLYRTSLNIPLLSFFIMTLTMSYFAAQPYLALRGAVYYAVSGFMITLLIINGETTQRFIKNTTRTVALLTVIVSLVGLFELFVIQHTSIAHAEAGLVQIGTHLPRISSTLGNPVTLSTYLVLGFPLLLCELAYAETKRSRDFWLVCATVVFTGIILTQTRLGLLALGVTGSVFFFKRSKRHFGVFLLSFGVLFCILLMLGGPRYTPHRVVFEWKQPVVNTIEYFSQIPASQLFAGVGTNKARSVLHTGMASDLDGPGVEKSLLANMHLILIIENGLMGWAIMMWIFYATLKSFYTSYQRVQDPRLQMILWAIFSSISGFLIAMNSFDAFFTLSIQILFWSLLGIGMAISTRYTDKKPSFVRLWRFRDAQL